MLRWDADAPDAARARDDCRQPTTTDEAEEAKMCVASQSSFTMAMERSAEFIREAERERQMCAAENRPAPHGGLAIGWRARWRKALVALAPAVGPGRATVTPRPS